METGKTEFLGNDMDEEKVNWGGMPLGMTFDDFIKNSTVTYAGNNMESPEEYTKRTGIKAIFSKESI